MFLPPLLPQASLNRRIVIPHFANSLTPRYSTMNVSIPPKFSIAASLRSATGVARL